LIFCSAACTAEVTPAQVEEAAETELNCEAAERVQRTLSTVSNTQTIRGVVASLWSQHLGIYSAFRNTDSPHTDIDVNNMRLVAWNAVGDESTLAIATSWNLGPYIPPSGCTGRASGGQHPLEAIIRCDIKQPDTWAYFRVAPQASNHWGLQRIAEQGSCTACHDGLIASTGLHPTALSARSAALAKIMSEGSTLPSDEEGLAALLRHPESQAWFDAMPRLEIKRTPDSAALTKANDALDQVASSRSGQNWGLHLKRLQDTLVSTPFANKVKTIFLRLSVSGGTPALSTLHTKLCDVLCGYGLTPNEIEQRFSQFIARAQTLSRQEIEALLSVYEQRQSVVPANFAMQDKLEKVLLPAPQTLAVFFALEQLGQQLEANDIPFDRSLFEYSQVLRRFTSMRVSYKYLPERATEPRKPLVPLFLLKDQGKELLKGVITILTKLN